MLSNRIHNLHAATVLRVLLSPLRDQLPQREAGCQLLVLQPRVRQRVRLVFLEPLHDLRALVALAAARRNWIMYQLLRDRTSVLLRRSDC